MKLSDQIRQAILDYPRSQYELAIRARIHQSQLSRFVRRKSKLAMDTLDKVASVLDLRVSAGPNESEPPK